MSDEQQVNPEIKIAEQELELRLAEMQERLALVERTFDSYRKAPPDAIPEQFRDLAPFFGKGTIVSGTVGQVEVKPYNAARGIPRYCVIRAVNSTTPDGPPLHVRLGAVRIGNVPQMQMDDTKCAYFVSTEFYSLRYGAPVNWHAFTWNQPAVFFIFNSQWNAVDVHIELWCEPTGPVDE